MKIFNNIPEIKSALKEDRKNKTIAFVPTMGSLHEGHLSLVKKAKEIADIVVVSIFVNKKQFNDAFDYEKYPQDVEGDLKKLEVLNIDYVFIPESLEMFPEDFSFHITPNSLSECLCGRLRPGHFEGVSIVLCKLFNIIDPTIAIFGQKDFQQLKIVEKMVKDLNFDIQIFGHEILRDEKGLAMSSRNQRLKIEDRKKAANIFRILSEIELEISAGLLEVEKLLQKKKQELLDFGFEKVDYLEIRQEKDLKLITEINPEEPSRIFIAVYLAGVRLIDNMSL